MKHLVVLSGAGISAESGIRTFRDNNGLWEEYRVEDVATPEGWYRNSQLVTEFYNQRRLQLITAKPCGAHSILADLEKDYQVDIITQNVDNLHEQAGSTHVLHLHGELNKVTSSIHPNDPSQIRILREEEYEIKMGDLAPDGSQFRPFIVWFGEAVPNIELAAEQCEQADIFVIIGTSLNVYPAAGLIHYTRPNIPIYLIDPAEVTCPPGYAIHVIRQSATAGMEQLRGILS